MNNVATIQGLGKKYQQITALSDFCLQVEPGDIYGIAGPGGSGKTTLLNILAGTVKPSSGTGRICDYPLGSTEARKVIGYVPFKPAFYPGLSVINYLIYMGMLAGVEKEEAESRAILLLKVIELYSFRDKKPHDLTPGMKTKIGIAQGFISKPKLILIDEPVTGLDESGKLAIWQIIREMSRAYGTSVLVSAENWTDIAPLADKIILLHKGKTLLNADTSVISQIYSHTVFSLKTTDNAGLLAAFENLAYLEQIILTEQGEQGVILVIAKEKDPFPRDLPEILARLNIGLLHFSQEEITTDILCRYLLSAGHLERRTDYSCG